MKTTIIGEKADEPTNLETVAMTIDEGSVSTLMSNLTNLYSDPVLAVVREYSSNALDSHIRSGQTLPIRVTMPNEYNPNFVVQDFGIGMSKDDIANIYSRYGLSTKNADNTEIGAFGLGCKSALAISDRFDLTAIKDGVKTIAFIKKNNKGVGVVHFVSEEKTSEANGVTVTIPIVENKVGAFEATKRIFDTWAVGSAIIDGEPNAGIQYGVDWVEITSGETIGWVEVKKNSTYRHLNSSFYGSSVWGKITLTIGGIPYSFEKMNFGFSRDENTLTSPLASGSELMKRLSVLLSYENRVVLNLPIGSVDLTPSRENLMITEKTIKTVVAVLNDFCENVRTAMNTHIQGLDMADAYKVYANNFSLLADEVDYGVTSRYTRTIKIYGQRPENYGVTYRNEVMPTWISVDAKKYGLIESINGQALEEAEVTDKVYTLNSLVGIYYSNNSNNILVQVTEPVLTPEVLSNVRKNLRDYAKAVFGDTTISAVITNDKKINKWVSTAYPVVSFDEFAETARKYRTQKKSEAQVGTRRSAISYVTLDLDPTSNNSEELHKVGIDTIGDGEGYIYVSADVNTLTAFGAGGVWNSVKEAIQRDNGYSFRDSFGGEAHKVFGNKKVVFIPAGKSVMAFTKRSPKAVSYNEAISNAVAETVKNGTYDVLVGVHSVAFRYTLTNARTGTSGFVYADKFIEIAKNLKGFVSDITDDYKREVFSVINQKNSTLALAKMLPELVDEVAHAHIFVESITHNYNEKYSLLNKIYETRNFAENEVAQVVALINGVK